MGGQFTFSSVEVKKSLKVFGWTIASASVALLISVVANIESPVEYAFVVPIINTMLYALKEFISDNREM